MRHSIEIDRVVVRGAAGIHPQADMDVIIRRAVAAALTTAPLPNGPMMKRSVVVRGPALISVAAIATTVGEGVSAALAGEAARG